MKRNGMAMLAIEWEDWQLITITRQKDRAKKKMDFGSWLLATEERQRGVDLKRRVRPIVLPLHTFQLAWWMRELKLSALIRCLFIKQPELLERFQKAITGLCVASLDKDDNVTELDDVSADEALSFHYGIGAYTATLARSGSNIIVASVEWH